LKEFQEISREPIIEKMIDMTSSYKEFIDEKSKIKFLQNEINDVIKIVEAPENLDEMTMDERQIQYEQMKNELEKKKDFFYTEFTKKLEVVEVKTEDKCEEKCAVIEDKNEAELEVKCEIIEKKNEVTLEEKYEVMEEKNEVVLEGKCEVIEEKNEVALEEKYEEKCEKKSEVTIEEKNKYVEFYREVMNNFLKVTNSFKAHLFEYVLVPHMPATNNSTEQFFGKVRTKLRRITGRQNNNTLIITRGDYIALTLNCNSYEDIKERISNVSYDDYKIEKEKCSKINFNYRIQSKVKKDPVGYLDMLIFGWKQTVTKEI
jgi:hypothetical protein